MILNGEQEQSGSQPEVYNPNPQPEQGQQQKQSGGGVSGMSSQLSEINQLFENVESLLDNDFIQNRIASKMNKGQGQGQRQPPQNPQPQPQPEPQVNQGQTPTQSGQEVVEKQVGYDNFDLREYFSHKIITESGRKELSEELDKLTDYIDGESSINQIQKELVSEEFAEEIKNLQDAGVLPNPEQEGEQENEENTEN